MQTTFKFPLLRAWLLAILIAGGTLSVRAAVTAADPLLAPPPSYQTELFGKKYRLDDHEGLAAYIQALNAAIDQSRQAKQANKEAKTEPERAKRSANTVDKKTRHAMEETVNVARMLSTATGPAHQKLLQDLTIMAGAVRASSLRLMPKDMDAFTALARERRLRHPPVGLGKSGIATDLPGTAADPAQRDPVLPSSYWTKRADIAAEDLYYGFGRTQLPCLEGEVCTYIGPKTGKGVHAGFEVQCDKYGRAKIKFGKQYAQPFAQRIFWALGFNTVPADHVAVVKVKWDPRIFTEFNSRQDERFAVKLFGLIPLHVEHLQHYIDPFAPLSEVIMLDANGKEVSIRPDPTWEAFKKQLYKDPRGRPETVPGNINAAFADRIRYLVYHNVDLQLKDEPEDNDEINLGNWDWNGEGNPGLRETRAAAFLAAWLNEFDPSVDNNRLTMIEKSEERTFRHYISDVGICLGRADDSTRMQEQLPNAFPWTFTRPARPGQTAIPLDGSYHPIVQNKAFEAADIYDARWMGSYLAALTQKQLLDALVASGMPSAWVRLYYDKLANRRNQALADLGLHYPSLPLLDASREFDYDPQQDGLMTITTCRNQKVAAPDEGWVIVKGQVCLRSQVQAGIPQRHRDSIARQ